MELGMLEFEVPATGMLPGIPGKRCAHCNTQTTPLWRNGPDGPKTLCNACGVRDNRRHAKVNTPTRAPLFTSGKKRPTTTL
jgi:Zn ribbon nucleic-acid-binding protein